MWLFKLGPNRLPHAEFSYSPPTPVSDQSMGFDASGSSDPDGSVAVYEWDLDNDGVWFNDVDLTTTSPTANWTYATPGVKNIALRVKDNGAFNPPGCTPGVDCTKLVSDPDYTTVTVQVNLPPVAEADGSYTVPEGDLLMLDGSGSSDPNGDKLTYAWDLDNDGAYDDSTAEKPTFSWPDDTGGPFTVGLKVSDSLLDDTDTATVTVTNVKPYVDVGYDLIVNEGTAWTKPGFFLDPGADTWTATVDYGDGSGAQPLALNPDKTFNLSHVYGDDGTFTVTVTVTDDDGGVGSDTAIVTVNNVAPTVNAGPNATINEGDTFSSSGSFTDPGADTWTATVDYGDGTGAQPLALNPDKTFNLSHVYGDDGTFTVTVTVTDDDGGVGSDTAIVTVNNVAPTVNAGPDQTIAEGSVASLGPATFNDKGTLDTHTATIDWGDGTPVEAGVVSEAPFGPPGSTSGASGTVSGSHVYADNGTYTVTVCVTDDEGATTCDSLTVTVNNVQPTVDAGPGATINQGDTFSSSGSFTDPGADSWTATVDYGDGSGVQPLALNPDKTFNLSHAYADDGTFTITVTVTDDDSGVGSDTAIVTVNPSALPVDAGPDATIDAGDTFNSAGSFTDSVGTSWTATVDYGDGSGVQPLALNPDKTFALSHTYAGGGTFTATVRVTNNFGTTGSDTATVTVRQGFVIGIPVGTQAGMSLAALLAVMLLALGMRRRRATV